MSVDWSAVKVWAMIALMAAAVAAAHMAGVMWWAGRRDFQIWSLAMDCQARILDLERRVLAAEKEFE